MQNSDEIPYGYCHCGCGVKTRLAPRTATMYGWTKDEPIRYLKGHSTRLTTPEYIVNKATGCWMCTRHVNSMGYAVMSKYVNNKSVGQEFAHRVYYERYKGKIPGGMVLDHLCKTPKCVNPDHLEAVTQAENVRRGNIVKLTKEQISNLKKELETIKYGGRKILAKKYGICEDHITKIKSGKFWSHIKPI